ncbi:hypothetical protein G6F42_010427 [Rhizopus arrhizus]|nr:hypothetical protein G6F42_010427 [Rhizopus arrhizus]
MIVHNNGALIWTCWFMTSLYITFDQSSSIVLKEEGEYMMVHEATMLLPVVVVVVAGPEESLEPVGKLPKRRQQRV